MADKVAVIESALGVCIVNWRAAELTIDCLRSLEPQVGEFRWCRVFVVDNASGDGSAEKIAAAVHEAGWGDWVELIRADTNGGFAAGNNLAIRRLLRERPDVDYVHLLNPDTVVRPQALSILVKFLEAHPEVGVAGGRSEDPDATPQLCCFRFPSRTGELLAYLRIGLVDRLLASRLGRVGIPEQPIPIDWVSGAHMMIRREVIDAIGLLDEGYFLYYEETDFTLRARRAGWRCWHVPESRVVHYVGQSSGVTRREGTPQRVPRYWFESRRRYFMLNHGRAYAMVADALAIAAFALWRGRRWLQRKPDRDPPGFLRDLFRGSSLLHGRATLGPRQSAL